MVKTLDEPARNTKRHEKERQDVDAIVNPAAIQIPGRSDTRPVHATNEHGRRKKDFRKRMRVIRAIADERAADGK